MGQTTTEHRIKRFWPKKKNRDENTALGDPRLQKPKNKDASKERHLEKRVGLFSRCDIPGGEINTRKIARGRDKGFRGSGGLGKTPKPQNRGEKIHVHVKTQGGRETRKKTKGEMESYLNRKRTKKKVRGG